MLGTCNATSRTTVRIYNDYTLLAQLLAESEKKNVPQYNTYSTYNDWLTTYCFIRYQISEKTTTVYLSWTTKSDLYNASDISLTSQIRTWVYVLAFLDIKHIRVNGDHRDERTRKVCKAGGAPLEARQRAGHWNRHSAHTHVPTCTVTTHIYATCTRKHYVNTNFSGSIITSRLLSTYYGEWHY